ncbi:MAG: hypothetical protein M1818_004957 [Claussenomyces sp. TS43310]|nr:MAG: hypothetical protein M1818_004957 [Claussenomyces sp. TS43310]
MPRRSSRKIDTLQSYAEVDVSPPAESPKTPTKKESGIEVSAKEAVTKSRAKVQQDTSKVDAALVAESAGKTKVSPGRRKLKSEIHVQDIVESKSTAPKKLSSQRRIKTEEDVIGSTVLQEENSSTECQVKTESEAFDLEVDSKSAPQKKSTKRKLEVNKTDYLADAEKKAKKPRKTKEEKEAEAMPLAARTAVQGLKRAMYIGAHVSAAGGVHNSVNNALHIGGNSFALFLKSQRKWESPPLSNEARDNFLAFCREHEYDAAKHVLPHGSYLVNLAQKEPDKAEQAYKCFLEDLQRCEALAIRLYNFHPGSTGGQPRHEAIARIAANLNKAHAATKTVITLLENMAGAGNVIGSTFEDLRDIIALIEDKSRIGVCIDTCHSFAAGYDLRSPEAFEKTMNRFSDIVGIKYLFALHLNDSKAPLSSNRDLHANIGTGFLGLRAFHNVMNYAPFQHLPMVLETPIDRKGEDGKAFEDKSVWANEIKLLEGLVGADAGTDAFKAEERRLQELGDSDREKFQAQVDKKVQKTLDAMFKASKGKGKKKKVVDEEDSDVESEGGCSH